MRTAVIPRLLLFLVVVASFAGCAAQRERVVPDAAYLERESGERAVIADIVPMGASWGEAAIWSKGAFLERRDEGRRAVIHVGLQVQNHLPEPLALNPSESTVRLNRDEQDLLLHPEASESRVTVPGRSKQEIDLTFPLPKDFSPSDVDSFSAKVTFERGGESANVEAHFREIAPPRHYYEPPLWWYSPYSRWYHPYPWRYRYFRRGAAVGTEVSTN